MSILATDLRHTGQRTGHRVVRWVAVASVAFVVAAALASAGAWLGWRDARPLPDDQRAREIVAEVLPGAPAGPIDRWDAIFGDRSPDWETRLLTDDEYDGGSVLVPAPVPDLVAVRATLERTGWRVLPHSGTERLSEMETVEFVTARRAGVELAVFRDGWTGDQGVVLQRPEPALVRPLALAGGVAGLLLGGWLALRFTARHVGRRRWNAPAWAGGALLALPSLAAVSALLDPAAAIPPDVPGAPWEGYVIFKLLTVLGLLAWGGAVVLRLRHRAVS
ncbi:hypothetical protein BJY16_003024 [Actinoplanes octamycinicus]|uniref:Uncharacterized protein n=1 Tax=Actinoplanes octamycinicus TaxID=135948 RepID=A0A7W7GWE8_9ACTN|nr:hypothetical protein [Actinoplanes octamycinicus]MBB4739565.1 hypothetical protein [Actinoplanes octamycinicus]GIE54746.1 hypothetical protein Aoc01nite_01480 [Actinoplanes octamycinicus]